MTTYEHTDALVVYGGGVERWQHTVSTRGPEPACPNREAPTYDYPGQVWRDALGAVIPCHHPAAMGPDCCNAFRLTGVRS